MNSFKTKQPALLIHGRILKKFQKKTFSTVSDESSHSGPMHLRDNTGKQPANPNVPSPERRRCAILRDISRLSAGDTAKN